MVDSQCSRNVFTALISLFSPLCWTTAARRVEPSLVPSWAASLRDAAALLEHQLRCGRCRQHAAAIDGGACTVVCSSAAAQVAHEQRRPAAALRTRRAELSWCSAPPVRLTPRLYIALNGAVSSRCRALSLCGFTAVERASFSLQQHAPRLRGRS